jgi:hypothetical protein
MLSVNEAGTSPSAITVIVFSGILEWSVPGVFKIPSAIAG